MTSGRGTERGNGHASEPGNEEECGPERGEEAADVVDVIRTLADRQTTTAPAPVEELLHRGRRARRTRVARRVAVGTGTLALVVAVAGVLAPAPAGRPSVVAPASATPTAGSGTGYQVTLTYSVQSQGRPEADYVATYRGEADPTQHRAYLTSDLTHEEWRIIDDQEFLHIGTGKWSKGHPPVGPLGTVEVSKLIAVTPQELLAHLRSLGSVTRSADGGTYVFSYVASDSAYTLEPATPGNTVTGTVVLDGDKYRSITLETVLVAASDAGADHDPVIRRMVVEFSGYGITVPVEVPVVGAP
ncbi:hypothetical protein GCM10010441_70050 [Kitasatospora paracochleata]|uniref:GerMN domain-containing protein n=1 Tax=Kitasatospora paracochleata TaxID=58354 RepID=A0ABT1JCC0_9ACTN|nr:hypothetical protein [Kitasatospora paracochleata]MCP2314336.1 hypothetical protein [Kitasatospora paracochleata]